MKIVSTGSCINIEGWLEQMGCFVNRDGYETKQADFRGEGEAEGQKALSFGEEETGFAGTLFLKEGEDVLTGWVDLSLKDRNSRVVSSFLPRDAVHFSFCVADAGRMLAMAMTTNQWWSTPFFIRSFAEMPRQTQALLGEGEDGYWCFLPVTDGTFKAALYQEGEGAALRLFPLCGGVDHLAGPLFVYAKDQDPYACIRKAYRSAWEQKLIDTPPKEDKEFPEQFRYFGWCSWDAFQHSVHSKGIYEKLEEFSAKNIPVHWLIVDDGWSASKNEKLVSFREDEQKFPEGLKTFIQTVKEKYGVQKVGVWHALTGYWMGIDPESGLALQEKEHLTTLRSGLCLPSPDREKGFFFWDHWHRYLKEQGVDFLKVDNQGSLETFLTYNTCAPLGVKNTHHALEDSVKLHFGSNMINCMAMDNDNMFRRTYSAVSRNSDDFFPERGHEGFRAHILQNAYNGIFQNELFYCDYDMWWSGHCTAKQNAFLRAISGGPVYVSDKVGETDAEAIRPLIEDDGEVILCDDCARPTKGCLFTDTVKEEKLLKLWNRRGACRALAVFHISGEKELRTTITLSDMFCSGRWLVYRYTAKTFSLLDDRSSLTVTLSPNDCEMLHFYPVSEDGMVTLGDLEKLIPLGGREKRQVSLSQLGL